MKMKIVVAVVIVCEKAFDMEDAENPGYSHYEVDMYAWIPQNDEVPSHRLSLRKNLETGEYEYYRHYISRSVVSFAGQTVVTNTDAGVQDEIVFKSKILQMALDFGVAQWNHFHLNWAKKTHDRDLVCIHKHPRKSMLCGVKEK